LLSKPRWNGSRVLFSIEIEGRVVACAISRAALEELGGGRYLRNGDLLHSFVQSSGRIHAIAAAILNDRPESVSTGTLSIWADDIDDPPSAPARSAGLVARESTTAEPCDGDLTKRYA
jgi:hypothetical protein